LFSKGAPGLDMVGRTEGGVKREGKADDWVKERISRVGKVWPRIITCLSHESGDKQRLIDGVRAN
jgi:hypothetical protein